MQIKTVITTIGAAAVTVALSTPASASLVYLGTTDTLGTGIGGQLTILSFSATAGTNSPAASIVRTASGDVINPEAGTQINGGANNQTRTLAAAGITNGSEFRLIWNVSEPGGDPGVNLDQGTLSVTFYTATGTGLHNAAYTGNVSLFPQVSTGVGGEGHVFGLDAAQQATLNTLISAFGASNIYVGLGNGINTTQNEGRVSLQNENGAFETFNLARGNFTPTVPEPTSLLLLGTGLMYGVSQLRKRQ